MRRRSPAQGGFTAEKTVRIGGFQTVITIDNRWIVPYCPFLLRQFECHMNVEICSTVTSIKYVLKYTFKGQDRAAYNLQSSDTPIDEISEYENKRYLGCCEASTTIFGLERNGHKPTVVTLDLHLEGQQEVHYQSNTSPQYLSQNPPKKTKLEAFFALCQADSFACTLLYHQVPEYYVWKTAQHSWDRRRVGGTRSIQQDGTSVIHGDAIGRLPMCSPRQGELYYLRILLINVVGPTSFANIRTLPSGQTCPTFKDACSTLGLLDDDSHLESAMIEIAQTSTAARLRNFFVTAVICCEPARPDTLLDTFLDALSEDFVMERRRIHADQNLGKFNNSYFYQFSHEYLFTTNSGVYDTKINKFTDQL